MTDEIGKTTTIGNTFFLKDREVKVEDQLVYAIGPTLCTYLNRLLKIVGMFRGDHAQVNIASTELVDWLAPEFERFGEDAFSIQFTDKNFFLNGQLLKFDQRAFQRNAGLKNQFLAWSINQITIQRGVGAAEFVAFAMAIQEAFNSQTFTLETFAQPNLKIESVVEKDLDLPDKDPAREMIELYAGLVVKTSIFFDRIKKGSASSARFVKRIVQKIADGLDENAHVFVGLINLRLIRGQDFVHATNTCIYSMLLAQAIKLDRQDVVRCGMTALTQNIERFRVKDENENADFRPGDETHFQTNLSSVVTLSEMGAHDVVSALRLVTSYERGFPFNKPLPKAWYQAKMRPHVLSRIIEVARHYDILTLGLTGDSAVKPDIALQKMMATMGTHYDPNLFKIFVNVVGVFPVGSAIELSNGDRAVVIRSPDIIAERGLSMANRPTVRLIEKADRIIDLAQPQHAGLRIVRIIDATELRDRPGIGFLF